MNIVDNNNISEIEDFVWPSFNMEELENLCAEAIKPKSIEKRKMVMVCGKLGFIGFLEILHDRKLTQIEKDNIPEGSYKISG